VDELAERLDTAEAQARIAPDLDALAELWADDLVITTPAGTSADKEAALRLVESGVLSFHEVERERDHVIRRDDLLITVGYEHVRTAHDRRTHRYTHVWAESEGRWRLLARHASPTDRPDRFRT
jgi:ketosteroid isomerase-like protein